jgi:hypothetical protein
LIKAAINYRREHPAHQNPHILYALLFNIRQVIELGLKDLSAQFRYIHGDIDAIFSHNLDELLRTSESLLTDHDGFTEVSWYEHWRVIKHHARFIIEDGPDSHSFRCPATRKNRPSISDEADMSFQSDADMFHRIRHAFGRITRLLMKDKRNDLRYFDTFQNCIRSSSRPTGLTF